MRSGMGGPTTFSMHGGASHWLHGWSCCQVSAEDRVMVAPDLCRMGAVCTCLQSEISPLLGVKRKLCAFLYSPSTLQSRVRDVLTLSS